MELSSEASRYFADPEAAALASAAGAGRIAEIDELIAKGANINAIGSDGMTPMIWAMLQNNKNGFGRLLELGADPNVTPPNHPAAVHVAAEVSDPDWLRLVLDHGGDANLPDQLGETPLFHAITPRSRINMQALVEHGADLDHRGSGDQTPWMRAASLNQYQLVFFLFEAGADHSLSDRWGTTIVDMLGDDESMDPNSDLFHWRSEVIEFLRAKGVEVENGAIGPIRTGTPGA